MGVLVACLVLLTVVQLIHHADIDSTESPSQLFAAGSPELITQRRLGSFNHPQAVQRAAGAQRQEQLGQHPTVHRVGPAVTAAVAASQPTTVITHTKSPQSKSPPAAHQHQHQHQQQHQQPSTTTISRDQIGPVDVVYLWVNGSDPQLHQEVQEYEYKAASAAAAQPVSSSPGVLDNPVCQARFDSSRDELKFSLRSLEMYMKWYRRLFIVTNGQVRGCRGTIPANLADDMLECIVMGVTTYAGMLVALLGSVSHRLVDTGRECVAVLHVGTFCQIC